MIGKYLNLFKTIFPKWNFFDESSEIPILVYRHDENEEWKIAFSPPSTSLLNLFHNPDGNFYLNHLSMMQYFLSDLELLSESEKIQDKSSYKILKSSIESISKKDFFQFKISYLSSNDFSDVLISPMYKKGEE